MKKELSILIPTYNCRCKEFVMVLHEQAVNIKDLQFEIIVADDGSPNQHFINNNRAIEKLSDVRYIIRKENVGRAAIRNFLASQAQYPWIIFIDGDMGLRHPDFLKRYMETEGDVIYGGYEIGVDEDDDSELAGNLRYRYEMKYELNRKAERRMQNPYKNFHTCNFIVRADIMKAIPFDENFHHYGFEDVLWGKRLQEKNIQLLHINNPVTFEEYEENDDFVEKTKEGLRTLYEFQKELDGYSTLLSHAKKINFLHLGWLYRWAYKKFRKPLKRNLVGNNPRIFLFNIYKILYFMHL